MYEDVLAFETALGVRFEWVLHVGDFGVWPHANRIDKATKKHDGANRGACILQSSCPIGLHHRGRPARAKGLARRAARIVTQETKSQAASARRASSLRVGSGGASIIVAAPSGVS